MRPVDVKARTHIKFSKENNDKDPKFLKILILCRGHMLLVILINCWNILRKKFSKIQIKKSLGLKSNKEKMRYIIC